MADEIAILIPDAAPFLTDAIELLLGQWLTPYPLRLLIKRPFLAKHKIALFPRCPR